MIVGKHYDSCQQGIRCARLGNLAEISDPRSFVNAECVHRCQTCTVPGLSHHWDTARCVSRQETGHWDRSKIARVGRHVNEALEASHGPVLRVTQAN